MSPGHLQAAAGAGAGCHGNCATWQRGCEAESELALQPPLLPTASHPGAGVLLSWCCRWQVALTCWGSRFLRGSDKSLMLLWCHPPRPAGVQGECIGTAHSEPLSALQLALSVCLGLREHERQLVRGVEAAASSVPHPIPSHPGAVSRAHQEPAASQSEARKKCAPESGPDGSGRWVRTN